MKRLSIFMFSLLAAAFTAQAQTEKTTGFAEWDPHPKMHPIPTEYLKEHAVVLLHTEVRDYKFEGRGTTLYSTVHNIIKVLDRTGIESFNRIDVPFSAGHSRVDSIKARVILPDGTTRDLKYEMLYVGGSEFFFALDGVEKNSEIEVLVKYKEMSDFFGSIQFQHSLPVLNTYFELNYPKEFTFNTKGYHGFPSGHEEIVGGHKQVKIYKANIPALEKQPYSFYDIYCMRLEFALDHSVNRNGDQHTDQMSWDYLANQNYEAFYKISENDKKAANTFLTTIGVRGGETEAQKIKLIEDGIKTNIVQYSELTGKDAENIDTIVSKRSASERGVVKLFCTCFRLAGVRHEIGVTSNRTEHTMDLKFINFAPLNNFVFYFPGTEKFLAPTDAYYRYPELPYTMIANKGVFCNTNPETEFNIGRTVTEATAIIRTIDPLATSETHDDMIADVTLDKDLNAEITLNYAYTGYSASGKREQLAKASGKQREEIIKDLVGFEVDKKPEHLVSYGTSNESFNDVYKQKPLLLTATVHTPALIEKAGDKYLMMIGEVLGGDDDMYSKDERILPIDIKYPHTSTRTVTINIPEGYKLENLEKLRIRSEHNDRDNGNVTASFSSDYQLRGHILVITIKESYTQLHYPVIEYDRFKQVINAAADFNKVVLVMVKDKKAMPKKKVKAATPKSAVVARAVVKPATAPKETKQTKQTKQTETKTNTESKYSSGTHHI